MKESYIIITDFRECFEGFDICWYDTLEEAIEDYDPLDWKQRLLKVEEITP